MLKGFVVLTMLTLIMIPVLIFSQRGPHTVYRPPADFSLRGVHFQSKHVEVNYAVPFGGVLEMYIYDEDSLLLYRGRRVIVSGENMLVLKTSSLNPGDSYLLKLSYKDDEKLKWLNIPHI